MTLSKEKAFELLNSIRERANEPEEWEATKVVELLHGQPIFRFTTVGAFAALAAGASPIETLLANIETGFMLGYEFRKSQELAEKVEKILQS